LITFQEIHTPTNKMDLAPIILFVYNRPDHTLRTLEALMANGLASDSTLYIYCDGARKPEEADAVNEVRNVIIERDKNIGLADSIVSGVTEVVNKHDKVIVLEDDIITSSGFLTYMNEAVRTYASNDEVMHVSGYMFPVETKLPSTFFYNTASCWGWATWKRSWDHLIVDTAKLKKEIDAINGWKQFNIGGYADFQEQLEANDQGLIKTWAVRWYASMFLKKGLALHPYPSLTQNIGHDGSGVNCDPSEIFNVDELADTIKVKRIDLTESQQAVSAMTNYYKNLRYPSLLARIRNKFNSLFSASL